MESLLDLAALLSRQNDTQRELLALENRKTDILIRGAPGELDEMINQQQPLLMQANALERERGALQSRLGLQGLRLRQIAERCGAEDRRPIETARLALSETLSKLQKASALNGRLLTTRIEAKSRLLEAFGMGGQQPSYARMYTKQRENV